MAKEKDTTDQAAEANPKDKWKPPRYCGKVSGGDPKKRTTVKDTKGGASEASHGSKDSA